MVCELQLEYFKLIEVVGRLILSGIMPVKGDLFMATKAKQGKRELIDTGTDKRYVRRNEKGQFEEVVDVGKSLSQDRRTKAKKTVPPGYGDKGDQKVRR